MPDLVFEWDPEKAAHNRRKHGVSFDDATSVFDDPLVLFLADWEHGEARIVAIGSAGSGRILFVVSVELEDVVRIVSARRATRLERRLYEEGE